MRLLLDSARVVAGEVSAGQLPIEPPQGAQVALHTAGADVDAPYVGAGVLIPAHPCCIQHLHVHTIISP